MGHNCCRFHSSGNTTSATKHEESPALYSRKLDSSSPFSNLQEKEDEKEQRGKSELSQTISDPANPFDDGQKQSQDLEANDQDQQERPQETLDIKSDAVNLGRGIHDHENFSGTENTLIVDEKRGITSDTRIIDQSHDPTFQSASGGICLEQSRNLHYWEESHDLQLAVTPISSADRGMETVEAKVKLLKEELDDFRQRQFEEERRKLEKDLQTKVEEIKQLEKDKKELLYRISSQAAAKLTHDNPNITDLSDQNRPTKISERFSELYDNQWTDAFENLQHKHHLSETEAIEFLLDVLSVSFDVCKEARRLKEGFLKTLKEYIGEDGDNENATILEVMRTLKGTKRNVKKMQKDFMENAHKKLVREKNCKEKLQDIRPYMEDCVDICLLMNIQEPPLELKGLVPLSGSPFDVSTFKPYTEVGNTIKYIVWPALYLFLDGPLLCRGVAQGMRDSSDVHKPMGEKHDANKKKVPREINRQERDSKLESINDLVLNGKNADIEPKKQEEKCKASPHFNKFIKSSLPQSQNETEMNITHFDKLGSSQLMDKTRQPTKTTSNHSTNTEQQTKVINPHKVISESKIIFTESIHL